jgi:hypothetical protein
MKAREFASVMFVVVGLLFFAQAMVLLQASLSFIKIGPPLLSIAMIFPTALTLYLGFYIIRVRDRLSEQVVPEGESEQASHVSKQELAAIAFAAVGLLLVGFGLPGTIKVIVQLFAVFQPAQAPSVMGAASETPVWEFRNVLPEALGVGIQLLFGLLVFWWSPRLAARFSGPSDGA